VICDVGPTGEYLPPVGQGSLDDWRESFERQARSLVIEGIDALHVETMSDLREARVALEVLRSLQTDIPVMVSLTFERKKRGFFTAFGNALVESLRILVSDGAEAVGANCSITSTEMLEMAMEAHGSVEAPLVMQPNAGQPRVTPEGVRYDQQPDEFAANMDTLVQQGIAAVGGCCGTDPRFIAALCRRIEARAGA
jgi:5-methyltetrahydrofolate--homocysteine methyltransferase